MDQPDPLVALWPDEALRTRNMEIVAAKHRGLTYTQIGHTYALSSDRCKVILREWRSVNPTIRGRDASEILDETLERYEAAIEELALVSHTTKHDAVKVGAIKARLEAIKQVTEILQATGNLPQDLGTLRVQLDQRAVAARFLAVFDELGLPDHVADRLLTALQDAPAAGGAG